MAMKKRMLKGIKGVGKVLTEPNRIDNGGGLSSLLIPRRFNMAGTAVVMGSLGTLSMGSTMLEARNKAVMGKVSYGAQARMTKAYTSGAVDAIHRASGGNYAVFSDMADDIVKGESLMGSIETYGATPELVASLYHMGGR